MSLAKPAPLLIAALLLALGTAACGEDVAPVPDPDAGLDAGSDAGTDAGSDAGSDAGDDAGTDREVDDPNAPTDITWTYGAPIAAPNESWTYVPFPEAKCGNGTETGIAVNLSTRSDDVLIFLSGGGACWDSLTCFMLKTATHLEDTMDGPAILAETNGLNRIFDRTSAANPFRDASFVYIPYCTGDVFSGTRTLTYPGDSQNRQVHHVGGSNMRAFLERLVPTFSTAERVWLTGASAGGFGATVNWWLAQDAFGDVRVDVINDGAALVDFDDARYAQMMAAWKPSMPPGCPSCLTHLSSLQPYYAARFEGPSRFGLLSSLEDKVITGFSGLPAATFRERVLAMRDAMGPNQKTFLIEGNQHVLMSQTPLPTTSGGVQVLTWVEQLISDDVAWDHQGP